MGWIGSAFAGFVCAVLCVSANQLVDRGLNCKTTASFGVAYSWDRVRDILMISFKKRRMSKLEAHPIYPINPSSKTPYPDRVWTIWCGSRVPGRVVLVSPCCH